MGPFCAQPNRSSYTGSDVVGGSEDDCVMADKRAKKGAKIARPVAPIKLIAPTKPERLEFPCIIFLTRRVCGRSGRDLFG